MLFQIKHYKGKEQSSKNLSQKHKDIVISLSKANDLTMNRENYLQIQVNKDYPPLNTSRMLEQEETSCDTWMVTL